MREIGPRLRDLGRWCSGGTPPKDVPELWSGEIPWISGKDFNDIRLRTTTDAIPLDAARSYSAIVPPGSLVMLVRGMALVHGLPVAQVYECTAINQDVRGLVLRPEFDPRFIHYALLAARPRLSAHVDRAAHGTARFVDGGYDVRLADPRAVDQEAIADFLDRECERINQVAASLKRMRDLVAEELQATVDDIVWRDMHRDRALRWMGCRCVTGPFGTVLSAQEYITGGIPFINPSHIHAGRLVPSDGETVSARTAQRLARFRLRAGDVIVGRKGALGRSALVTCREDGWLVGSDSIALRVDPTLVLPEFAAALLRTTSVRSGLLARSSGATLANMNERSLLDIRCPDLHRDAQELGVRLLQEADKAASLKDAVISSTRARLADYRNALITEAVTGQLDVARLSEAQLDESARAALEGEPPEVLAS